MVLVCSCMSYDMDDNQIEVSVNALLRFEERVDRKQFVKSFVGHVNHPSPFVSIERLLSSKQET